MQLYPRLLNPIAVVAIDDENERLRAREVVAPERTNFILSADILLRNAQISCGSSRLRRGSETYPDIELDILICNRLDVEPNRRNRCHPLVELKLVQNRYAHISSVAIPLFPIPPVSELTGLPSGIETQHQQPHLLASEQLRLFILSANNPPSPYRSCCTHHHL